jgi:hypothetical protein
MRLSQCGSTRELNIVRTLEQTAGLSSSWSILGLGSVCTENRMTEWRVRVDAAWLGNDASYFGCGLGSVVRIGLCYGA